MAVKKHLHSSSGVREVVSGTNRVSQQGVKHKNATKFRCVLLLFAKKIDDDSVYSMEVLNKIKFKNVL
jgi:hypothetical protein